MLEAAYFSPSSIRKTARELNINTDAKYKFLDDGTVQYSIDDKVIDVAKPIVKYSKTLTKASDIELELKENTKNYSFLSAHYIY